jgi:hypothetical protein
LAARGSSSNSTDMDRRVLFPGGFESLPRPYQWSGLPICKTFVMGICN